jgi:hypothetical protein
MSAKHDGENEPGYWRTHVASCRKIFAKVHGRTFIVKRRFAIPSAKDSGDRLEESLPCWRYAMTETKRSGMKASEPLRVCRRLLTLRRWSDGK